MLLKVNILFVCSMVVAAEEGPTLCLDCDRQMRKVFEAMQAWRRNHEGTYPSSLADLGGAGLLPQGGEVCPSVSAEQKLANPRSDEQTSTGVGADHRAAYEYELSKDAEHIMPRDFLPKDFPKKSRMDAKAPLLRRPFANQVPILRCSSHRDLAKQLQRPDATDARRNLTVSGEVYWSGTYWEQNWLNEVPLIARSSQIYFGIQGPPFHSGLAPQLESAIDLRPWITSFGNHTWWWTLPLFELGDRQQPAPSLRPFFDEMSGQVRNVAQTEYWIDGLVQLQGKVAATSETMFDYPGQETFAWGKHDLAINRIFREARWLQATVWRADVGEVAGHLKWHYDDDTFEKVPIIVGVNTNRFWCRREQQPAAPSLEPVWIHVESGVIGKRHDRELRLFEHVWQNPKPGVRVRSLSFESNRECTAAPFLVALSIYP